jgi:predicted MPP superfamily phosphohydrolase
VARKLTRREAIAAITLPLAGTSIYGVASSSQLRVERRTIHLEDWPHEGFRLVQVSDVHVNDVAKTFVAYQAMELAIAEKPDLIVFTGDFVNFATDDCLMNIERAFAPLANSQCPCLGILGNHDYWCGAVDKVVERVKKTPLRLLINQVVDVQGVSVCGLDDALSGKPEWSLPRERSIVLLHEPDFVRSLQKGPAISLSGHSHGGEICLPGGIPFYTPTGSKLYKVGYYDRESVPLFVSRGIATLGPARCFCPAEINVLTLKKA